MASHSGATGAAIVSRPWSGGWSLVALALCFCAMAAYIALSDPPRTRADSISLETFAALPALVALGLSLYLLRHRVVADADGLRWRGAWTGWKSARWAEVSDFYQESPSSKSTSRRVETRSGTLVFGANDTCAGALAAAIAARALNAPFGVRQATGLRAGERFERRFATREVLGWIAASVFAALVLLTWAAFPVVFPDFWRNWQRLGQLFSPATAALIYLAPAGIVSALIAAMGTLLLAPPLSARWSRERITATQNGLRFEKRGRVLQIEWAELRAIHLLRERAHFVTARGDWEASWRPALRPLVERFAPDAVFDAEAAELDLVRPSRQPSGAVSYPFRTWTSRLLLQILAPVTLMFAAFVALVRLTPSLEWPRDDSMWLVLTPMLAFCLWLGRLYLRGGIALRDDGVELRGAVRDRFYAWAAIERCGEKNGAFWIAVSGRRVTLWSWNAPVSCGDVKQEIERRCSVS